MLLKGKPILYRRYLNRALLAIILVFSLLRFVHLRADFPMQDWFELAAYTDEGWYNSAAVMATNAGNWLTPGDFNPVIATPVLPAVNYVLFRIFGSRLEIARGFDAFCFCLSLLTGYALIRRFEGRLFALSATALCAVSFYCFAFSRLALLEYPALVLLLASLYCAALRRRSAIGRGALAGVFFAAAVMTKMSAAFAMLPIAYMLFVQSGRRSDALKACAAAIAACLLVAALWFKLLIAPNIADFTYFMSLQHAVRPSLPSLSMSAARSLWHGMNMGPVLYPLALVGGIVCLGLAKLRKRPLFVSTSLWILGYLAYLTFRAYAPIRYYPMIYPMIAITLIYTVQAAFRRSFRLGYAAGAIIILCGIGNAAEVVNYITHPRYSFVAMAMDISRQVRKAGQGTVLLGHFANTIALVDYLPVANVDYGSTPLLTRLQTYRPRFFVGTEPNYSGQHDLNRYCRLTLLRSYQVFGTGPASSFVNLYRLDPLPGNRL